MRKLAIFSAITLAVVLSVPYFIGMKCKDEFFEKIALAKSQLPPELQDSVQITAYHTGWLTSTAQITITSPYKIYGAPDIVFQSVIHHGPIISVNHSYKLGFGSVESTLALPEIFQAPLRQMSNNQDPLFTIFTEIKQFGKEWDNHYIIKSLSMPGVFQWDGLAGDFAIKTNDHRITSIENHLVVGTLKTEDAGFGIPKVSSSPIMYNQTLQMISDKEWKGSSSVNINNIAVDQQRDIGFQLNDFSYQLSGGINNGLASYQSSAKLASLVIPATAPLTKISNFQQTLEINNIDFSKGMSGSTYRDRGANRIFKMLTQNSSMKVTAGFDSNLGSSVAQMQMSLSGSPAALLQITDKLLINMNLVVAVPLGDYLLSLYLPNKEDSNKLLDSLIANNYLVKQDNNYYFKLELANNKITVTKAAPTDLTTFANNIAPLFENSHAVAGSQTNEMLQMIQGITAAAEGLAQMEGSFTSKNVTAESVKGLLPNNSLTSPWGTTVSIAVQSPSSFQVIIPDTPAAVCAQLKIRMQQNPNYKVDNNACSGAADFSYVYSNQSYAAPAQPSAQTVQPKAPAAINTPAMPNAPVEK